MSLRMFCDACGVEVPRAVNGAVRVRIGDVEWSFHLCPAHGVALVTSVEGLLDGTLSDYLTKGPGGKPS